MTRPTPETDSVIAANHENGWTGATGIEMLEELARQLENDRDALREELAELKEEWSFDTVLRVGREILRETYPETVFTGVSGDSGPVFIVALRNAIAAIDAARKL